MKTLFLDAERRPAADAAFVRKLKSRAWLVGPGTFVTTTAIYLVVLFVLFVLLAYRPGQFFPIEYAPQGVAVEPTDTQGSGPGADNAAGAEAGAQQLDSGAVLLPEQMYNRHGWLALREYVARVAGTVPAECAVTELVIAIPEVARADPASVRPWFLQPSTENERPCEWRNEYRALLAAFSPDVGPVQKFTILMLIYGIVLLWGQRRAYLLDAAVFPGRDPGDIAGNRRTREEQYRTERSHGDAWLQTVDPQSIEQVEHPYLRYRRLADSQADSPLPLYPVHLVGLEPLDQPGGDTAAYRDVLRGIRRSLTGRALSAPVDLILDVVEFAGAAGRVGAAAERLHEAVFAYRERLLNRLWPVDYLLWLLPTIGFLGTIYGISASLTRAKSLFSSGDAGAGSGDFSSNIQAVVDGLGVAFDTTSIALVSAAILFLLLRITEARLSNLTEAAERTLSSLLLDRMVDRDRLPPRPAKGDEP